MATVSLYLRTTEEGKHVYRLADTRKQAQEGVYFLANCLLDHLRPSKK